MALREVGVEMTHMLCELIMKELKALGDPKIAEAMARFGIFTNAYGVPMPQMKKIGKRVGKDHNLAQELWQTTIYEARVVASIDDPNMVTEEQLEEWAKDFDNWAICDNCCSILFDKTVFAYKKAVEWSIREEEYVKRAGFVIIAVLAVHDKKASDDVFLKFLETIKYGAADNRNFVKKAVNWALRQIGKRNFRLNNVAIATANEIHKMESSSAKWIATNAIRELKSPAVPSEKMAEQY